MAYVQPVINEACRKAQLRRLANQSKATKITLEQAIAQCKDVLEKGAEERR
jgi:hypothetical protein